MNRFVVRYSHLSIAGWVLAIGAALVMPAHGQEPEKSPVEKAAEPSTRKAASNQTAAVVMGKAIASSEVEKTTELLKKRNPAASDELLFWEARKDMAVRTLIAETARLFAEDVKDDEVIRYHKLVYEDEESDIVDDIDDRRNEYLIELYLEGRLGRSQRLKGVSPDYAEFIRVTPEELRTAFRQYNAMVLEAEPVVKVAQFLFPPSAQSDGAALMQEVKACREKLKAIEPDETELRTLAESYKGCLFKIQDPSSLHKNFQEFAKSGNVGDVSAPFPLGKGAVVYYILAREEIEELTFDQFQDKYMNSLIRNKIIAAKEAIIHSLILEADYYPLDLFFKAKEQPSSQFQQMGR
ncbi:MAG: peptidylprolyl isomerase [Planctomycetota bacterium]